MKVYKNKNLQEWCPTTGTHYSQRITLTQSEQRSYKLNLPIGTHYPSLSILDYFSGEVFRRHKMNYCNTCIRIIPDRASKSNSVLGEALK